MRRFNCEVYLAIGTFDINVYLIRFIAGKTALIVHPQFVVIITLWEEIVRHVCIIGISHRKDTLIGLIYTTVCIPSKFILVKLSVTVRPAIPLQHNVIRADIGIPQLRIHGAANGLIRIPRFSSDDQTIMTVTTFIEHRGTEALIAVP